MRNRQLMFIVIAATLTASAIGQSLWQEPKELGLWSGGESLLSKPLTGVSLVPPTVSETGLKGVSLFNDPDNNRYGSISDIGGGQVLINTQGSQNTLRSCHKDALGTIMCN
jgi:hypothetical protein